ncbi:hypothetical protein C2E21_6990 [Chlorella sorokiniana]|uniref:Apple domain-containing protein n=1 Tax=Chlorella sorokiniana TaxID=3076 RepID=A0A2P6TJF6_CHLSO|nr:hypothetical protein C2E21_6990 [Chlorella sorokiniana]|eukprot:PRW39380.1 hypothetical protein C2E21_6990 [Chlorella sorokiniana]
MGAPARLLAAAALLCLCSTVAARSLKQDLSAKIWSNYTLERATFYMSLQMKLPAPKTDSAEKCAEACLADEKCLFWSWCPSSVSAGCTVAGTNGTTAQTLPATTCILSWDTSKDSLAVFAMYGEDNVTVPWMAGMYEPPGTSVTSEEEGIPVKIPGLTRRRLLATAPSSAAVWKEFSYEPNLAYLAVDQLGSTNVKTVDDCATECQKNSACEFFLFCPTSNSGGCPLPAQGSNLPSSFPPGQCVTTGDAVANRTAVLTVFGTGIKFQSGARIAGNQPANETTASPSPSPSASPAASPAAAGAPPASPAPNPDDPLTWVDPAPDGPEECQGKMTGRCDYDSGWIGRTEVNCELDRAGLSALAFNAIEFSCPVDQDKEPNIQCDWKDVRNKLPGCAWDPTKRILATWRPGK